MTPDNLILSIDRHLGVVDGLDHSIRHEIITRIVTLTKLADDPLVLDDRLVWMIGTGLKKWFNEQGHIITPSMIDEMVGAIQSRVLPEWIDGDLARRLVWAKHQLTDRLATEAIDEALSELLSLRRRVAILEIQLSDHRQDESAPSSISN